MLRAMIKQRFGFSPANGCDVEEPSDPLFRRILGRGVTRDFLPDPVPDGLFRLLTACALSAPSKSDLQQSAIIEIVSPEQRAAVADLVPNLTWVRAAPRLLLFCGDARRLEEIARFHGHRLDNGTVEGFMNAAVDAALVMQTFMLAADAAGLGSCPISNFRYRGDELAALLSLPDRVFPVAGLALGYARSKSRIKPRLPLALSVHRDRYGSQEFAAAIEAYDRRRSSHDGGSEGIWSSERIRHQDAEKARSFARYLLRSGFHFAPGEADSE